MTGGGGSVPVRVEGSFGKVNGWLGYHIGAPGITKARDQRGARKGREVGHTGQL